MRQVFNSLAKWQIRFKQLNNNSDHKKYEKIYQQVINRY